MSPRRARVQTLEAVIERFLVSNGREAMAELAAHVLAEARAGHLTVEDTSWVEHQAVHGLHMGLAQRLDAKRVSIGGTPWSTRKFMAQLDEEGRHTWSTIEQVLAASPTSSLRLDSKRHCWSVVDEHIAGLQAQHRMLVLLGEDEAVVREQFMKRFIAADLAPVLA